MMLDFLFRRGNPTNGWRRSPNLSLAVELSKPALNGIALGAQFGHLAFLGRNDSSQFGTLCYFDLGLGVECTAGGTFDGFSVVFFDEHNLFSPYCGKLTWQGKQFDPRQEPQIDIAIQFGP